MGKKGIVENVVVQEEAGIITVKSFGSAVQKTASKVASKAADNTIKGTKKAEVLFGELSDDTIKGLAGDDKLYGREGDDKLYGGVGNDKLYGGDGDDKLYGEKGKDILYGGDGEDYLSGGAGNDKLYGGDGDDQLYGDADNDRLFGGDGEDVLYGGKGDDRLTGGGGSDVFVYTDGDGNDRIEDYQASDAITVTKGTVSGIDWKNWRHDAILTIGKGSIRIRDLADRRIMFKDSFGTTGYFYVIKKDANNKQNPYFNMMSLDPDFKGTIDTSMFFGEGSGRYTEIWNDGTTANVTVIGNNDNNYMYGGQGSDKLYGRGGDNFLTGDKGKDTFGFEAASTGYNEILDYKTGEDIIAFKDGITYEGSVAGDDVILDLSTGGTVNILGAAGKEISLDLKGDGKITKKTFA